MDPMYQSQVKDWVILLSVLATMGTLLYIIATTLRRRQRHQMQQHVLDKFASAKDFADFLQTPAGQKYMMNFADTAVSVKGSILNSVRLGIVLVFTGVGLQTTSFGAMRVGVVLATVGVGFLVAAGIAYVLARTMKANGGE